MQLELPTRWQRDYDVYDRLAELGIDLGRREDAIAPETNRIPRLIFTPSGLLFFSGSGRGRGSGHQRRVLGRERTRRRQGRGPQAHLRAALGSAPLWHAERRLVLRQVHRHGAFSPPRRVLYQRSLAWWTDTQKFGTMYSAAPCRVAPRRASPTAALAGTAAVH